MRLLLQILIGVESTKDIPVHPPGQQVFRYLNIPDFPLFPLKKNSISYIEFRFVRNTISFLEKTFHKELLG